MITLVANLKGGVGKSTLAFHLIVWLLHNKRKVLAIDADPQQTLSDIMEVRDEEKILPTVELSNNALMLLAKSVGAKKEVVIDAGAQGAHAFKQAIIKADRILIPVMPSQADVWATQRFLKFIKELRGQDLPELLALVNRGDPNPDNPDTMDTHEILGTIKELSVIDYVIYDDEDFRSALFEGQACFELNPNGTAAKEFIRVAGLLYDAN